MSSTRRTILAALSVALLPAGAWATDKTTLANGETWLVGLEGDSELTGSAGDDTIYGDPLARTATPQRLDRISTGYEQPVANGPFLHGQDARRLKLSWIPSSDGVLAGWRPYADHQQGEEPLAVI